ncbi:MAG: hypothetical protein KF883_17015, partial [Thermomicrobiales bacterium]|nr:hypothetical protein [Thermomicrobiales bacterium]
AQVLPMYPVHTRSGGISRSGLATLQIANPPYLNERSLDPARDDNVVGGEKSLTPDPSPDRGREE